MSDSDEIIDLGSEKLLPAAPKDTATQQMRRRKERYALYVHAGISKAEIKRLLGIAQHTEERYREDPEVLATLETLRQKEETHILLLRDKLRSEALNILDDQLGMYRDNTTPPATRAAIGMDLLDREGSLPKRQMHTHEGDGLTKIPDEQMERVFGTLFQGKAISVSATKQELTISATEGTENGSQAKTVETRPDQEIGGRVED